MTQAVTFSNRYQLERGIARGGMAQVYLAHDQILDRRVAIKVLFPEFARDPSFVERFRREAQAAANLSHPNIVAIYDWGQERGTYFIVMEYVEGQSLRDLIRTEGPLPAPRAAEIGAEIAGALAFAHRNGVVHRDVKPGNVLMTPSGQVKVTDFGIARATQSESGEALTQTGAVMGTATYFSPEQAQGLPVDGRSDVYSLGVVLYELVTGDTPFRGDTPVAVAYKHVREQPEPPSQRVAGVAPDFERIVMAAMAKDVDERYQSADDLRDDLVAFVRGREPTKAPVTAVLAETTGESAGATQAMAPVAAAEIDDDYDDIYAPGRGRGRNVAGAVFAGILAMLLVGVVVAALLGVFTPERSSGKKIDVPVVVGQQFDAAKAALEDKGFEVERKDVHSTKPANEVVDQTPGRGEKLEKGKTVTLEVSEAQVKMPNLVGQQCTAAQAQLAELGLVPLQLTEGGALGQVECVDEDSDQPPGTVLRTEPPEGSLVAKDGTTRVTLVQAKQATIALPEVKNLKATDAKTLLEQAGLKVTTQNENSVDVENGNATRTDPAAGTQVKKGDSVVLYISTGPADVEVPDTRGMTQQQAQDQLIIRGFNVLVQFQAAPGPQKGKVIDQDPLGGTAPQGSTVTIVVGQ